MSDTPPGDETPRAGETLGIGTPDRILAGVLLLGSLALAYICLDVMTDGRITGAVLQRRGPGEDDG